MTDPTTPEAPAPPAPWAPSDAEKARDAAFPCPECRLTYGKHLPTCPHYQRPETD